MNIIDQSLVILTEESPLDFVLLEGMRKFIPTLKFDEKVHSMMPPAAAFFLSDANLKLEFNAHISDNRKLFRTVVRSMFTASVLYKSAAQLENIPALVDSLMAIIVPCNIAAMGFNIQFYVQLTESKYNAYEANEKFGVSEITKKSIDNSHGNEVTTIVKFGKVKEMSSDEIDAVIIQLNINIPISKENTITTPDALKHNYLNNYVNYLAEEIEKELQ